MRSSRFGLVLGFIFLGILSRFLPHPPNFTAINSIALFSAYTLGSMNLSLAIVFLALFLSDALIGFHDTMVFVYLAFSLVLILGRYFLTRPSLGRTLVVLPTSSLLFFTIVNFGVWLTSGMYPKTAAGLVLCYTAALPFLANQILGDLLYGTALFGCFALVEKTFFSVKKDQDTQDLWDLQDKNATL